MIVTIDGPAGSGKSTAAKGLARRLGFCFLDSGAMYRAIGVACRRRDADLRDPAAATAVAETVQIAFRDSCVLIDDEDVTDAIRTSEGAEGASLVATHPGVRRALVDQQRRIASGTDVVTEGRDQGTVAFPDAECKFYLVADVRTRAERRLRDFQRQNESVSLEEVEAQIRDRDERDSSREASPLRPADDAIRVDTTGMTPDGVLDHLEKTVRQHMRKTTQSHSLDRSNKS